MKVLVVDDSVVMRKIITGALAKEGITDVAHAGDGVKAVEKASDDAFDLILMDWNMPAMTGLEAVKAIRSKGLNIPIIMVTTEAEKQRIIEAIQAGANNYICKPFEPDLLMEKIKDTMDKI